MVCNCNNADQSNTIKFVKGTTVNLTFNFDTDISTYTGAEFTIRKNYDTTPVIDMTEGIEITENTINLELTPSDTNNFTEFLNGKDSASYIWGLDLLDEANNIRINVFPQTGQAAPLCIVYKHVVEG